MSAQMDPMGEDHMNQITNHIEHLKEEAAADPQNPGPLMELGSIYLQVFKFQEASEYFEKALAIDPQNLDVRTNLGMCWLRLEKGSEARTLFARSVEIAAEGIDKPFRPGPYISARERPATAER